MTAKGELLWHPGRDALRSALQALRNLTFRAAQEERLQEALDERLAPLGFLREHFLDAVNRADFFHPDGVAVEVKVDGSAYLVARQLSRYLRCPDVHAVLLITTRAAHVRLANPPRCEVILLRTWP